MNGFAGLAASQKALRFSCILLAAMTLASPVAFGGVNRWTSGGQLGGFIDSLAIDPMNPETVYAGTGRAVLKSTDGGLTWTSSFAIFSGDNSFIGSLAIDPSSSASIYAATTGGLFKSVDAGGTWKDIFDARVYSLAVDPFSPSTIFAGTAGGLAKSTDGGATWSGRLLAASIYNLVFSREGPSTIIGADFDPSYYPDTGSHLYRSTDGGANWTQSDCIPNIPPGALAVDPTSSSTLYTGSLRAASGLFKTVDSGLTWSLVNDGAYATAVVIDPQNPGTIYAAAQGGGGFIRSTDGGASWQDFNTGLNPPPLWITALAIDQTGTRLYAGTDYGEVFSYRISSDASDLSSALDLSVGTDNKTRTLFVDSGHLAVVRSFDNSGNSSASGPHGPYSGWSARAVADGPDGLTRLLWNNPDGSAALWLLGPTGNQASYRYDPTAGWTAADVSVGRDGATHLLWTNVDGRTKLTTVAVSGAVVGETTYGPYNGWIARSISDGADGLTRILWTNNDGRAGLSLVAPETETEIAATYRFVPEPGWTARDVAVSADNQARVLFANAVGQMALWSVDNSGTVTNSGKVFAPPRPGQAAVRVSAGADGLTRVLWTGPDGTGYVGMMDGENVLVHSFGFCGSFGESSGCGPWDY
ncbi:MAG TPA: sialidase family protein [Thermoanaerobaculia bacterium]